MNIVKTLIMRFSRIRHITIKVATVIKEVDRFISIGSEIDSEWEVCGTIS
jgi:hypothetical protein